LLTRLAQNQAQTAAALGERPAEDQADLPEESRHFDDQEQPQELQARYPNDSYPEPSVPLPPRSSALLPPALAVAALYGIAGRVVCSLTPHTEADPAAVLLQFLAAFGNLVGPAPHAVWVPRATV
jgi:hypothetical protein